MPPKKKAAGSGDAAKGEKVFKNLCSACHSLSVSLIQIHDSLLIPSFLQLTYNSLTQPDPPSEVSVAPTLHQEKVSTTHRPLPPRPPWSGLTATSTSGSSRLLVSPQVTPWLSPVSVLRRIALIWLLILRVVEQRASFYQCCLESASRVY